MRSARSFGPCPLPPLQRFFFFLFFFFFSLAIGSSGSSCAFDIVSMSCISAFASNSLRLTGEFSRTTDRGRDQISGRQNRSCAETASCVASTSSSHEAPRNLLFNLPTLYLKDRVIFAQAVQTHPILRNIHILKSPQRV